MGEAVELERFFREVMLCQDKVTYGPKSVKLALEQQAVETLLISDKLFRAKNTQ
jgi:stalled ribosome rescue protein Dom34